MTQINVGAENAPQVLVFQMQVTNDAFVPNPVPEVVRLLRKYADAIEQNNSLRGAEFIDINGNRCGHCMVVGKVAEELPPIESVVSA